MTAFEADWDGLSRKWAKIVNNAGPSFFTPELQRRFQTDLIYLSSNLERIEIDYDEAATIVNCYPDRPPILDSNRLVILQAIGQRRAFDTIENAIQTPASYGLPSFIRQLHYDIMQEVDPRNAGRYRTAHVTITGSRIMTSLPSTIAAEIVSLATQVEQFFQGVDTRDIQETVQFAAFVHHDITRIHPFDDANGRVARLVLNFLLRLRGLPYLSLPKVGVEVPMDEVIRQADAGNLQPAARFYGGLLHDSLDTILVHYGII